MGLTVTLPIGFASAGRLGIRCRSSPLGQHEKTWSRKAAALVTTFPQEGTIMNTPLQIAFHNLPHSQAVEDAVREAAVRLEAHHDRIVSCHVVIDQPHRHHREGNLFEVRIDLKMPGSEIVVKRELSGGLTGGDLLMLVQGAFDELQRQIEESVNRRRGFVKAHEGQAHARVVRLFPDAGYGFLETSEGREVFFHQNSVLDKAFKQLEVGAEVCFVEELGEKGAQASTVRVVGRHNHAS